MELDDGDDSEWDQEKLDSYIEKYMYKKLAKFSDSDPGLKDM